MMCEIKYRYIDVRNEFLNFVQFHFSKTPRGFALLKPSFRLGYNLPMSWNRMCVSPLALDVLHENRCGYPLVWSRIISIVSGSTVIDCRKHNRPLCKIWSWEWLCWKTNFGNSLAVLTRFSVFQKTAESQLPVLTFRHRFGNIFLKSILNWLSSFRTSLELLIRIWPLGDLDRWIWQRVVNQVVTALTLILFTSRVIATVLPA